MSRLTHRLGFTPRAAHVRRRQAANLPREAAFQAALSGTLASPDMKHSHLMDWDGTAVRIVVGRTSTWAKTGADGVWIDSDGSRKDCFTVLAR
jgi:hypothetical protein